MTILRLLLALAVALVGVGAFALALVAIGYVALAPFFDQLDASFTHGARLLASSALLVVLSHFSNQVSAALAETPSSNSSNG